MKLIDYLNLYKDGCSIDTSDTEIDAVVNVDYDKNAKPDEEFPYLQKFSIALFSKVDLAYLIDGAYCSAVVDYSKLITDNIELFRNFVKTTWREDKQYVLEDMTELQYEFIKDINLMLAGYGTETDNRNYYELISECRG
jgi:hypothetical protein